MRVQEDDILSYSQFKQYNIIAAKMFQHAIDPSYQERISVEGIYDVRLPSTHPALEPISRNPKRKLGIYDVRNTLATQYHPALKPIT